MSELYKLSAQEIDQELIDRDKRKPIRKLFDDKVLPVSKALIGAGAATVGAIASLKTVDKAHHVE